MDSKSKILTYILITLLVLSVSASFYRFIILKDYVIEAQVDCDPQTESCFVWNCESGVDCTGNPEEDVWYYKIVYRNAQYIPACDPTDDSCNLYACEEGELDCSVTYCDATTDVCSVQQIEETISDEVVSETEVSDDTSTTTEASSEIEEESEDAAN